MGDAPAAALMGRVVGAVDGELLKRPEVRLDGVWSARIDGRVDRLDTLVSHERPEPGVLVTVQVIHHDVEADLQRVAGPQPREDGQQVLHNLTLAHLADKPLTHPVSGSKLASANQLHPNPRWSAAW